MLCQVAGESALLKNSVLAFDGFAGFTPSQLRVLEELLVYCPESISDGDARCEGECIREAAEHDLFAPSRRLVQAVSEAARSAARRMWRKGVSGHSENLSEYAKKINAPECAVSEGDSANGQDDLMFLPPVVLGKTTLPRFKKGGACFIWSRIFSAAADRATEGFRTRFPCTFPKIRRRRCNFCGADDLVSGAGEGSALPGYRSHYGRSFFL